MCSLSWWSSSRWKIGVVDVIATEATAAEDDADADAGANDAAARADAPSVVGAATSAVADCTATDCSCPQLRLRIASARTVASDEPAAASRGARLVSSSGGRLTARGVGHRRVLRVEELHILAVEQQLVLVQSRRSIPGRRLAVAVAAKQQRAAIAAAVERRVPDLEQ